MAQRSGAGRTILSALALFASSVYSQGCYYPDGITLSNDVPCNPNGSQTSCCASQAFCLDNGLCYGNGLVSRGSCTDKTWQSTSCAGYCRTEHKSESVTLTPCSSTSGTNLFTCGLNTTRCSTNTNTFPVQGGSGLVLRPSQVAQLIQPALASATRLPGAGDHYTVTQLIGVAVGVAVPLLIALGITVFFLMREKRRHVSTVSRELNIRDDKGYRNLQADPPVFSPSTRMPSAPTTPGYNNPPGYNSPISSPTENNDMATSGLAQHPAATYARTLSSARNNPLPGTGEGQINSRPPSSRGSARHTIFPQATSTSIMPNQSPTSNSNLRAMPLSNLDSRGSIRSQSTHNNTPVTSPQQAHMPGFPDTEDATQQRSPMLRVATIQSITPVLRASDMRQNNVSESNTPNMNTQQRQMGTVQDYQRNMANQYAGIMDSYTSDTNGRAELDSADNRVLRHELGDGRRSWVKK